MSTTTPGYIVATAFRGHDEWTVRAGHASKPSAETMRQYRQAWPNLRVKRFTDAQWDALPIGKQEGDWSYREDGSPFLSEYGTREVITA